MNTKRGCDDVAPTSDALLTRRRLVALLGLGGAATIGPWRWLGASAPPDDGLEVPVPSTEPALFQPPPAPTEADLAASLGWDIEAMFRHVADHVDYEPYNGALRGARGALWGQAANSVDKALLLGALLTEAGLSWRFAIGGLGESAHQQVLDRPVRSSAEAKRRLANVLLPPDVAAEWTGDGPWRRDRETDELFRRAAERTEETSSMLVDALTAAGVEPPARVTSLPAEEAARHVWVQVADGPAWIDLDPTLPGAATGTALTEAVETPSELPDDLFHTVTLRLVAEVVTAGVPALTEVVSHQVRAVDVVGVPIYVVHAPASWLDIAGAVTGDQRYRPTILVGDEIVQSSTFVSLAKGEGALAALGEAADAEGQTLAEWLAVDVTIPDAGTASHSRLLFDRIPPERRSSDGVRLDDLPPVELVHVDDEIGDIYPPCAAPLIIGVAGHAIPWGLVGPAADGDAADASEAVARSVVAYGAARDVVILDQAERLLGSAVSTSPTVVCMRTVVRDGTIDDQPVMSHGLDIVHSGMLCDRTRIDAEAPWSGVRLGAAHHATERMLLETVRASLGAMTGDPAEISVGAIFDAAIVAGHGILVLSPGDAVGVENISPAARALIYAALARGNHVVVPDRSVLLLGSPRIGWWEYDPVTGSAFDTLDSGGHATLAEYGQLLLLIVVVCTAAQAAYYQSNMRLRGFTGAAALSGFPAGQSAAFCSLGAPVTMGAIAAYGAFESAAAPPPPPDVF